MKHATQWKNMKIYIMYVPFKFELEIVKKKIFFFITVCSTSKLFYVICITHHNHALWFTNIQNI